LALLDDDQNLTIVYDGDCPFCRSYVVYSRLKSRFPQVRLLDARTQPELVRGFRERGYDLTEGMLVIERGQIRHGAEAMGYIAHMTRQSGILNRVLDRVFRREGPGKLTYAMLRGGRSAVLKLLGRSPL
jgi:predicted DCC family thiol-disulfide oxidoreductase YuxK